MKRVQLFMVLMLIIPVGSILAVERNTQVIGNNNATWLWHTQEITQDPHNILAFLTKNNIQDLYLHVDYDLDINNYKEFIQQATKKGINVHALEGRPDWITSDGLQMQHVFFNWVNKYQNDALDDEKFKGIHLDVEPYLHEGYYSNRNKALEAYQNCIQNALRQSEKLGLPLSIDIPFWFDELEYNTQYGQGILADWIISRVKNVVIMAYRDEALGDNGIINLVSKEMALAKQYGSSIIIAVETEHSKEGDHVSFYDKGRRYMNKELHKVYKKYGKTTSFGGFGIHHLPSWMNLKK